MTRRFSSRDLTALRNRIPVSGLLERVLQAPEHTFGAKRRFACPRCAGFNTSVHSLHNLFRCFDCLKNFNPIELVMQWRKTDFVTSVNFLKQARLSAQADPPATEPPTNGKQPVAIGSILAAVLPTLSPADTPRPSQVPITVRIEQLERKIDRLCTLVEQLQHQIHST